MSPALEAKSIVYRSGGRTLIDKIDLSLASGSFQVIVGPNGAGKSTLLRLLCGELVPAQGEILLQGRPLHSLPAWRLAHVRAFMPQASELSFPFTVREVVSLGQEGIGQGLSRRGRHILALEALGHADAEHLVDRNYQTLSGGERQRVHFARVLAQLQAGRTMEDRQVLFLDEPTASLDLKHQLSVLRKARELTRSGLTVIAVLHDLQLAAGIGDELILMDGGRLIAHGPSGTALTPLSLAEIFGVSLMSKTVAPFPWRLIDEERSSTEQLTIPP